MKQRHSLLAPLLLLLLLDVPFFGTAAPGVSITSPSNNFVSLVSTVNVTGSATGSNDAWSQTTQADFDSGTKENVVSSPGGNISLFDSGTYDDFNDNSLDTNRWTVALLQGGMAVTEQNGMYRASGTNTAGAYWNCNSWLVSTQVFSSFAVSAELKAYQGTGSGHQSQLAIFVDSNNYVSIGPQYDRALYGNTLEYVSHTSISGVTGTIALGSAGTGLHTYGISISGGVASLYSDGSLLTTRNGYGGFTNPKAEISADIRANGDTVDSSWDNVRKALGAVFGPSGNFTSSVFDALTTGIVLDKTSWTVDLPANTGVTVQLRSSDSSDMASPTPWATVTSGQTSGLPSVKRYLQYRAVLTSYDGINTPVLKDVTIDYIVPVDRVEASIDSKATWLPASGAGSWSIGLELPDGPTYVWVRVTDVLGDTSVTSIKVDVDTTRPTGTVVINDDDPFTIERQVTLALDASDRYGIAWMMVGERPDLGDAEWKTYSPTSDFLLSTGDGKKTVYARFKDANGWESKTVNDSIVLDTLPPTGTVAIEGGAAVTRNVTVTLTLNATDQLGVSKMQLSNLADMSDASWTDYHTALSWSLVEGNGARNVYARFQDAAGHDSRVYNASIFLDTTAPGLIIKINGGASFTTTANVTVDLQAIENHRVDSMQVAEGSTPFFSSMAWAPWRTTLGFQLSSIEGTKTVTARLQDAAGNIGQANSTSIILDHTPPATKISEIAAVMPRARFTVSWNGTDTASGVLWYDVQYSVENGTWNDWQTHTNTTSALFTGHDLSAYSFRARAQDRAGNLEPFPETADKTVLVQLPEPVVTIIEPASNAVVRGKAVTARGTCRLVPEGRTVDQVPVRIDNGTWETADGTLNWSFTFDTAKLKNGLHTLTVRTYDGERYSSEIGSQFTVRNTTPVTTGDQLPMYLAAIIIMIIVAGIAAFALTRRRKPRAPADPAANARPQAYQYAPVQQQPPPPPAPQPRPSIPSGPPPAMQRQSRIFELLGAVSAGLPRELQGLPREDLAELIASGDEGESPEGERLVKVLEHWYFGDENKPGLFMRLYK